VQVEQQAAKLKHLAGEMQMTLFCASAPLSEAKGVYGWPGKVIDAAVDLV
jgi:hypothetical protein